MAAEKNVGSLPFIGKRGTSLPTGGGWENLPMGERLRQTFERGLTRVELDLADAYNKKILPGQIPEAQKRITKQIAAEFGAQFSVHAPYQVDVSSQSWGQRIEAAEVMRQSIKYAKEMGAKYVTFHPTANLSGASFLDPFTWQATPVQAHLMMRDKTEFTNWCTRNGISKDSPIYEKLQTEAGIMYNAQSMQFTQHYAASAPMYAQEFGATGARTDALKRAIELLNKGEGNDEKIRQETIAAANSYITSANDNVRRGASAFFQQLASKEEFERFIANAKELAKSRDVEETLKDLERGKESKWQFATMATGGRINKDGSTIDSKFEYDGMGDPNRDLFMASESQFGGDKKAWEAYKDNFKSSGSGQDAARRMNFAIAMTLNRQIDLTGVSSAPDATKATEAWVNNLKETFDDVFRNKEVQENLTKHGIVLSAENLWGVNPEAGVLDAAGYFNKAEHMVKAVEALREVAKKHGIPEEHIKMTFDTEHAAIGSQTDPTKFLKELKESGKEGMVGHVHLVGGGSTASIFGHKGFGSIEDDVARKNPELLQKLVEMGVPLTFEPGSGGIKDVEGGIETLLLGAPLDTLQAANMLGKGAPEEELIRTMGTLGYQKGAPTLAYGGGQRGGGYFASFAAQNDSMIEKSMYSFGPSVPQHWRPSYSALASPSLYQGGISHQMPGSNIWGGSQPLTYSMKNKE